MIDQIKSLNNPPRLVGTIMELMFTLLHQYGTGTEQETGVTPGGTSSLTSTPGIRSCNQTKNNLFEAATYLSVVLQKCPFMASTAFSFISLLALLPWCSLFLLPGHPLPSKKRTSGGVIASSLSADSSKMEKEQWMAIQLAIGDSQKFLDLLNGLKWENGLSLNALNLIESRIATSHTSPKAAEPSGSAPSTAGSIDTRQPSLITVSMARHAAESAATMCAFAVAIVEYHYSFKPYKLAVEKLQR